MITRTLVTATLAFALAMPALAQGVETTQQAEAAFNEARNSGPKPLTADERLQCVGYWWALERIHEVHGEEAFWAGMPMMLSAKAAKLYREGLGSMVGQEYEGDALTRASQKVQDYHNEALQKVAASNETSEEFFETLGVCSHVE